MSSRVLYQDQTVALTDDAMVLRGFTRILGRARRIELNKIASFTMRERRDFPNEQLPRWGLDDRGVWYTRDSRRWRRQYAIELAFDNGEKFGFTPAHPARFTELLTQLGVTSS